MARRELTKNTAPPGQGTYRISDTRCGRHLPANTARSTERWHCALTFTLQWLRSVMEMAFTASPVALLDRLPMPAYAGELTPGG